MGKDFHDDEMMDYLADLEDALREVLDELPEFHDLMDFLDKRHGNVSIFMGVQVSGDKPESFKKCARNKQGKKGFINNVPLKFEFNAKDKKFLKSLRIDLES
jgi:hypothetical protein